MREYSQKSYYQDEKGITEQKFIDVHISIKVALEWFLSTLLFKKDLKRVLYSSQDMAFRKRIEYLDSKESYDEEDEIKPERLDLPFATYINTSDPEPDDRPASASAAQSIIGEWDQNFETSIRSLAIKQTYKATIFFARRDEVRLAQQLLLWEKEPKFPVRMYHTVKWRGCNLTIPINVTIENINTTPDYKESDWLTKNRIFPVEVEMTVRTYQLLVNTIEKLYQLPIRFSNVIDDYDEEQPPIDYITEEVVLNWASDKFDLDMDRNKVDFGSDDIQDLLQSPYMFNQKDLTESEKLSSVAEIPNEHTTDVVQGYFQTDSSVALNRITYNVNRSTGTTAWFDFAVKPSTYKYFDKMIISVPLKKPVEITDCKARSAIVTGLVQHSTYKATIEVYGLDGTIKTYFLTFTTPGFETAKEPDKTPTPEKINKTPGLVGMRLF